jgi:hypothetical protein
LDRRKNVELFVHIPLEDSSRSGESMTIRSLKPAVFALVGRVLPHWKPSQKAANRRVVQRKMKGLFVYGVLFPN